jgi:hypothetical protein
MKTLSTLIVGCLLSVALSVSAHHSNTPFDMSKTMHATGVVEKVDFKNPHSLLTLGIDSGSDKNSVMYEGHSLATLRHYGLRPSMVKVGDKISIAYAPRRDQVPGGIFLAVTTAAGETLDFSHLGYE